MADVLIFSSQVAYGYVGNSAMQFPLQRLGLRCASLPSVLLSNRPDYPAAGKAPLGVETLDAMLAAMEANGWLKGLRAVITGYLPRPAHVELAARWIARLQAANPGLTYICDPVIGDEPEGVYIDAGAAGALKELLLPLAQAATPNRFELAWLTGRLIATPEDAAAASLALGSPMVLATSAPAERPNRFANLLTLPDESWMATVDRRDGVPHGTGDFLAAVFAAHLLLGHSPQAALALATASMDALVSASVGAQELDLVASQSVWAEPMPWPIHELRLDEPRPAAAPAMLMTA